jgi:hypothetical protein
MSLTKRHYKKLCINKVHVPHLEGNKSVDIFWGEPYSSLSQSVQHTLVFMPDPTSESLPQLWLDMKCPSKRFMLETGAQIMALFGKVLGILGGEI